MWKIVHLMVKSNTMPFVSYGSTALVLDSVILHLYTGVKVRVYCQVGKANQGKFALTIALRTLEFYKE
jgi:aminopeptidase N